MIQVVIGVFVLLVVILILVICLPPKEEKPDFDLLIRNFREQMKDMEIKIEKNEQTINALRKKIYKYKRRR